MRSLPLAAFIAAFAALGGLYTWARLRAEFGSVSVSPEPTISVTSAGKHRVTSEWHQDNASRNPAGT
jgi:hypothetical protein